MVLNNDNLFSPSHPRVRQSLTQESDLTVQLDRTARMNRSKSAKFQGLLWSGLTEYSARLIRIFSADRAAALNTGLAAARLFLALVIVTALGCSRSLERAPYVPSPTPAQLACPYGTRIDHFSERCVRVEADAGSLPVHEHSDHAPRIGLSLSGRPGISFGRGLGLHIDHRGRVGLGFGL